MLLLSRQVGQKIMIGDNIVVTVLRIGREKVRIDVSAPPAMPIRLSDEKRWPDLHAGPPQAIHEPPPARLPRQRSVPPRA